MPRVSDQFLESVIFLYKSEDEARQGIGAGGGSGFILGIRYKVPRLFHYYLVTNRHVVEHGARWARLATRPWEKDPFGGLKTHGTALSDWELDPEADVAVCSFEAPEEWNFACVDSGALLTAQQIERWGIGVGDDLFVAARLVGFEGQLRNTPVLHTGAISMMAGDPIPNSETGQQERGHLAEIHSRGGFSGSPVFGFLSPKQYQLGGPHREDVGEVGYLLGIIWANIMENYPVMSRNTGKQTGDYVRLPRGIAGIVPSERIKGLLDRDRFASARSITEGIWMDNHPDSESHVEPLHTGDEPPMGPVAELMGRLLQVPKSEADEVHRSHEG